MMKELILISRIHYYLVEGILPGSTKTFYYCYGQFKSIHPIIIDCDTFILTFGDWINGKKIINSYIYFEISRLDISWDL